VLALLGTVVAFTISGAGARFDCQTNANRGRDKRGRYGVSAAGCASCGRAARPARSLSAVSGRTRGHLSKAARHRSGTAGASAANALQEEIWKQAVAAVRGSEAPPYAATLVLPALNGMFDIATT